MSVKQDITAFIYDRKGRVLSVGKNSYEKTHTLQAKHAKKVGKPGAVYLHAEIHAISLCKDLKKAHKILVTRYGTTGRPLLAKPCPICQSAIDHVGIKVIEYTVEEAAK